MNVLMPVSVLPKVGGKAPSAILWVLGFLAVAVIVAKATDRTKQPKQ